MKFQSYKIPRYFVSTDLYRAYESTHPFRSMCKKCGYPYGEHSGNNNCPNTDGYIYYSTHYTPKFYIEDLNKNIHIL